MCNEESVDLYIHRLAELKAVQIGRVSRILKESSVDCLLNHSQTNFSQAMMNTVVKQNLSSGIVLDYQVGDKPYSSTCDYILFFPLIKRFDYIIHIIFLFMQ